MQFTVQNRVDLPQVEALQRSVRCCDVLFSVPSARYPRTAVYTKYGHKIFVGCKENFTMAHHRGAMAADEIKYALLCASAGPPSLFEAMSVESNVYCTYCAVLYYIALCCTAL